jgi:hypothetical protein
VHRTFGRSEHRPARLASLRWLVPPKPEGRRRKRGGRDSNVANSSAIVEEVHETRDDARALAEGTAHPVCWTKANDVSIACGA